MLNKKGFETFRQGAEKALLSLAKEFNVDIKAGKIKYTDNSFNLELVVSKKEVNGKPFEQAEFEKNCVLYGLKPEDYNRVVTVQGREFTVFGLDIKARKRPVLVRDSEGKVFTFTEEAVQRLITK